MHGYITSLASNYLWGGERRDGNGREGTETGGKEGLGEVRARRNIGQYW